MANLNQKALDQVTAAAAGPVFKLPSSKITAQAWLDAGGGTATVLVEVTNDPRAETDQANAVWVNLGTIGLSGANNTDGFSMDCTWAYTRVRVSAVAGGAKVTGYVAS